MIFVAFCVFLWCQGKIFIVQSRIRRRIFTEQTLSSTDLHNKREKAFALLFITLSFVLCWFLPMIYLVYSSIFGRSQILHEYVLPWYVIIFMSTILSPMVYYWRLKAVRNEAWKPFLQKSSMKLMNFPNSCFKPLDAEGEKFRPHKLWDKSMAVWLILPGDLHI